jgi:hypothetical protein
MSDENGIGYIGLFRELLIKPIWHNSTPEQKVILITLLLMANHQEKEWEWGGSKFKARPGQFVTSLESIQKNAGKGISQQNVRTALKRFKNLEFLTDESTKTGRLVTIVNWELYQVKKLRANKATNIELTDASQTPNKDLTPNKNDKNDKNDNPPIVPQGMFERFWDAYPKKKSKGQAEKAFSKLKVDEQFLEVILAAIERAKKSTDWQKDNGQYIPYPATWLNARGWEDEQAISSMCREPKKKEKYDDFYL